MRLRATPVIGLFLAAFQPCLAQERQEIMSADVVVPREEVILVRGELRDKFASPVASTSFRATSLAARTISSLDDLVIAAPGLHMINDQDPGTNIVSLRGVTTDRLQQAAIAYVIDDVPLADTEFFTGRLFDLAGVEVLRGPQGALFGKNAAGGAIEMLTRTADDEERHVAIGAGNGEMRTASLGMGGAIGPLAVRIAGLWEDSEGFITNRTLNKKVDGAESRNLRLRAVTNFGRAVIDAKLQWTRETGGAAWASSNDVTGDFGGELSGAALTDPIGDFEGRAAREWTQASLRLRRSFLGGDAFILLARDDYQKRWVEELDYRPGPLTFFGAPLFPDGLQPIGQPTDIGASTFEARWSTQFDGDDSQWRMMLGAFAQDIDRDRIDDFGPLLFGADAPAYETDSLQTALFAAFTRTSARTTLDLQGRWDKDVRSQAISNSRTGTRLETREADFSRFQPRLAFSYRVAGQTWIYATYGEGFRTGGFNPAPSPSSVWEATFDPEITRSVELGLKANWRGANEASAKIEAAVFSSEITNFQSYTFLDGNSVTLSVDQVDVRGLELSARLARGAFQLGGAFALADAEIGAYVAPDPIAPGATRDYRGRQTPNAPAWTATISPAWVREFGAAFVFNAQLDFNATGETFFEIDNALRAPGKTWIDARLALSNAHWSAAFWAKNLTDERWAISAFGQGMLPLLVGLGPGGPFDTFTLNRGRQVGVELKRTF